MTTPPAATEITLPRLEGESARAYAARVAYVTMGPQRSIDKVAGQTRGKSGVRSTTLQEWSSRFEWVESARRYDEAMALITVQEAAAAYRRDLEEHRERYGRTGKELHGLARAYMAKLAERLRSLDAAAISPSRLALDVRTVASALTVAADLEAHALRLDALLPALGEAGDD